MGAFCFCSLPLEGALYLMASSPPQGSALSLPMALACSGRQGTAMNTILINCHPLFELTEKLAQK